MDVKVKEGQVDKVICLLDFFIRGNCCNVEGVNQEFTKQILAR